MKSFQSLAHGINFKLHLFACGLRVFRHLPVCRSPRLQDQEPGGPKGAATARAGTLHVDWKAKTIEGRGDKM